MNVQSTRVSKHIKGDVQGTDLSAGQLWATHTSLEFSVHFWEYSGAQCTSYLESQCARSMDHQVTPALYSTRVNHPHKLAEVGSLFHPEEIKVRQWSYYLLDGRWSVRAGPIAGTELIDLAIGKTVMKIS